MRNYRPGMLVNWTSLYFFLVFFSFQLYFLGFCSLKSLKLNWYSFWNVYYIAYRIDSSQVEPFESCNSCSIFHLKKPKLITPQWIFIMHIKFAHTSSTHYDVAGDENRLWKWNSPYLKYFSKLQTQLGTYSIFILNTLYIKQIFKAMTSLWHDESPSHFSTVNQQIVIIFSLPILIDRIFEKFLGPPFCKIHHHGPHFWKKENYLDTLSIKALVGIRFLFVLDFKYIPI